MAVQVDNHPVPVYAPATGESVTVTNRAGQTVYYGLTSQVDATDSLGSLTAGQSAAFSGPARWFVCPTGAAYLEVTSATPLIDKTMLSPGGFGTAFGSTIFPSMCGAISDTAPNANRLYCVEVTVPWPQTFIGVAFWAGSTITGNVQSALYDATGTRLALSASVAIGGATLKQGVPFSASIAVAQGTYFAALAFSTVTGKFYGASILGAAFLVNSAMPPPATVTPADSGGILQVLPVMALY